MFGYLYAYVLGGFTFIPLVVVTLFIYIRIYASTPVGDVDSDKERKKEIELASELREVKENQSVDTKPPLPQPPGASKHLTGWMTVRRTFYPPGSQSTVNTAQKSTSSADGTGTDPSKVEPMNGDKEKESDSTSTNTSGKYSTMLLNSYRSIVDSRSASPSGGPTATPAQAVGSASTAPSHPPKEFLFCALKGSVIFMYENEDQKDCVGVIGVDGFTVGISRGDEEDPELAADGALAAKGKSRMLDGELFAKRHAIVLRQIPHHVERKKGGRRGTRSRSNTAMNVLLKGMDDGNASPSQSVMNGSENQNLAHAAEDDAAKRRRERKERQRERERVEAQPWYFFAKNNVKMEQWYHALLSQASPLPAAPSETSRPGSATHGKVFSRDDMQNLIDTLNHESDPIPIRWANAMLGRIFLGLCRTAALEAFIIGKMMKKIKRIKTPYFLGDIVVKEVDVGTSPPFFSKPMLKELTPEGEASFEVEVHYKGEFKIRIATTATIPTGFSKPYKINLELVAILKGLHGNMVFQIKKPPSNRIWYSFTRMPEIDLLVEPVVSDRKIQLGMVLKAIEKQIREAIADSVVLPNMDDLAFFDTQHLRIRGGIFDEAGKHEGVPIAGDITGDGLEPIPLSDTKALPQEDSDGGTQTGVRHRKSKLSPAQPTMATDALDLPDGSQATEIKPVIRAETTPNPAQNRAFGSSLEATKKWFAHKANTSGEFGQISESKPSGTESPERISSEREPPDLKPRFEAAENGFILGTSAQTKVADTTVEAATATSDKAGPSAVLDQTDDDDVPLAKLTRTASASQSQVRTPRNGHVNSSSLDVGSSLSSSNGSQPFLAPTAIPAPAVSAPTAAHLMGSLRSRTADKKALQASVNQARDVMKTWGNRWTAKRKSISGDFNALEESVAIAESKLKEPGHHGAETALNQRGHAVAESKTAKPMDIARPSGSLQDRLAAAAAAASGPRNPASSLTASVGSATSEEHHEYRGGDTGHKPLAERKHSDASSISTASAPANVTSSSVSPPADALSTAQKAIRQQPVGHSSMVVPRVPKRPDTITSVSSTSGLKSTTNSPQLVKSKPLAEADNAQPKPSAQPPALPKRSKSSAPAQMTDAPDFPRSSSAESGLGATPPAEPLVEDTVSEATSAATPQIPALASTGVGDAPALPPRKTLPTSGSLRKLPEDNSNLKSEDVVSTSVANAASGSSPRSASDVLKHMVAMDEKSRTRPGTPEVS